MYSSRAFCVITEGKGRVFANFMYPWLSLVFLVFSLFADSSKGDVSGDNSKPKKAASLPKDDDNEAFDDKFDDDDCLSLDGKNREQDSDGDGRERHVREQERRYANNARERYIRKYC